MQTRTDLTSSGVGRRPAENPLAVAISFRVDQATADALDEELAARLTPGLALSRNDVARMLMAERLAEVRALAARSPKKPGKK
jgi:hypothetical protein